MLLFAIIPRQRSHGRTRVSAGGGPDVRTVAAAGAAAQSDRAARRRHERQGSRVRDRLRGVEHVRRDVQEDDGRDAEGVGDAARCATDQVDPSVAGRTRVPCPTLRA